MDPFPDGIILQPECNFLHGFFRCCLPVETVDVKVKITSMQGIDTFRMCQIIKCNPWSTRLHPHPSLIKKMRTYLELEGKLGPKPKPQQKQNQPKPVQCSKNPLIRRGTTNNDERRKLIPTKRYKLWVVARPIQAPAPKTDYVTTQMPVTIPITMANLVKGKLSENPPQGGSSVDSHPPPLENIPVKIKIIYFKVLNL